MLEAFELIATLMLTALVVGLTVFCRIQARRVNVLAIALKEEHRAREEMARDLTALLGCSREIGGRLNAQAARQKSVLERINEIAQQVDGSDAIGQVERLIADGLGVDQIKRVCELSQGEAALLARWNRHRSAA